MSKACRKRTACRCCGAEIPLEDQLSTWLREHPQLESGEGFVFFDHDIVCHRYKFDHDRGFQCIMFIEVKRRGERFDEAQRDTFRILDQIMRNRRSTPTKVRKRQLETGAPNKVWSVKNQRWVDLKAFGHHTLRLSDLTPETSSLIKWDGRQITLEQLISLLRFDLDPDTLHPMNWRKHHRQKPCDQQEFPITHIFDPSSTASFGTETVHRSLADKE